MKTGYREDIEEAIFFLKKGYNFDEIMIELDLMISDQVRELIIKKAQKIISKNSKKRI